MRSCAFDRSIFAGLLALLLSVGGARVAAAQQAESCGYTTCALRLQYRGLGDRRLVAGEMAAPADRGGLFSRRIPLFEARTDSVHFHYIEYRSHAKRSGLLALLGAVAVGVGSAIDYDASSGNKVAKISLISSGIIVGAIASINHSRSEDHLQRAIWLYNRDLPR